MKIILDFVTNSSEADYYDCYEPSGTKKGGSKKGGSKKNGSTSTDTTRNYPPDADKWYYDCKDCNCDCDCNDCRGW